MLLPVVLLQNCVQSYRYHIDNWNPTIDMSTVRFRWQTFNFSCIKVGH